MRAMKRFSAAVLALSLVGLSPGLSCYQALAVEIKLPVVQQRLTAEPLVRPIAIPEPTVGVNPVLFKADLNAAGIATVRVASIQAITPPEASAVPWRERLTRLGERFTGIIGLKGAGEQSAGFRGFFDLGGLQPAYAMSGESRLPLYDESLPRPLLMSVAREERTGVGRSGPPASKNPLALQERLALRSRGAGAKLFAYGLLNSALSLIAAHAAAGAGVKLSSAVILALVPVATTLAYAFMRRTAEAKLSSAEKKRDFSALFAGDRQTSRSVWVARLGALAAMDLGGMLMLRLMHSNPLAAAALGAAVLAGWAVWRLAKKYGQAVGLQRAGLYGVLKEGQPQTPIEDLPGKTALEKHGRYFSGGKEVATFWTTYRYVRQTGLSAFGSFTTAASWHLFFSGKTQKNMTAEERSRFHPGRFDVYTPNFADAQGPTNTRIYAMQDIPGVAKRGDVDMREFERIFRDFAGGRDYVTWKELQELWKANAARDAGRTNWISRRMGKIAFNKRYSQQFAILADRAVEEEGKLVPALSRAGLLRSYQGGALFDLLRERNGS